MQTLLSEDQINFKTKISNFTNKYFTAKKDLKPFLHSLYTEQLYSENITFMEKVLLVESVSKINCGVGLYLLTQFACIEILQIFGTETQKNNHLKDLISGKKISTFCLTEENAGSDISQINTTAKVEHDLFNISGSKIWSSNGEIADMFFLFAQCNEIGDKKGISCFLCQTSPNINIHSSSPKIGIKITPSNKIDFKDLKIKKESLIQNVGDGIKIALSTISVGRVLCAAQAVGLLSGILEESAKHSKKRNQFGKSISDFQTIQWYLADMQKDLDASKLLCYKAAWAKENNPSEFQKLSSMAKYYATESASIHSNKAIQIHGGKGLTEGSLISSSLTDAKVLEIYEGTNEIQKSILQRELNLI